MKIKEKHSFPDCLDYVESDENISYDDEYMYDEATCSKCGKKVIWKYRLLGIFNEEDNLIRGVYHDESTGSHRWGFCPFCSKKLPRISED